VNKCLRLITTIILSIGGLNGCSNKGPVEIHYGQDQCEYCNMNIVDKSFGSQLVTNKGKAFKFDSIECLAAFEQTAESDLTMNGSSWVTDFKNPGKFIKIDSAKLIFNEAHSSPMGVGLLGFSSESDADNYLSENGGQKMKWADVLSLVKSKWKL
jgi:copper chaperone NosL